MTVPVCRRGHCGPRRWWGDDLSLWPHVLLNLWACLAVAKTVFTNVLWLESSKLGHTFILDDSEMCVMVLMYTQPWTAGRSVPLLLKCCIWSSTFCCMIRWKLQRGRNCTNHTKWIVWYAKTKMESSLLHIWFSYDLKYIAFGAVVITLAAVWQGKLI